MSKTGSMFNILPISKLNVSRYTWDAWEKIYPGTNKNEWNFVTIPQSVLDFLMRMEEEQNIPEETTYRVCVIDEEYFDWLNKNNKTDSGEERLEYIRSMSDEDADRLLEKNELGIEESFMFVPFVVSKNGFFKKGETFAVPKNVREKIGKYLKEKFDAEDVFVGDYLMDVFDIADYSDNLYNDVVYGNSIKSWGKTVDRTGLNVLYLALPIVLRLKVNSATINLMELDEKLMFPDVMDIEESENLANFTNGKTEFVYMPFLGDALDAVEWAQEFHECLMEDAKNTNAIVKFL